MALMELKERYVLKYKQQRQRERKGGRKQRKKKGMRKGRGEKRREGGEGKGARVLGRKGM